MTERHLIVIDLETTGLNVIQDVPVEVAVMNASTGERFQFVPHVSRDRLKSADPESLAVNRFYERRLFDRMLSPNNTREAYLRLAKMLKGNTFAGANPAFDSAILRNIFVGSIGIDPQWHHRLADLSAITAGLFNIPPTELPGLKDCCLRFGFQIEEGYAPHTAMGDVLATAECFTRLATGSYPLPTGEVPF
ncbi:3'-5' exonuclease [Rhodococcus sp. IEGM 1366]|uniref:3'-5' exonuclease n=1 Tax=Rhodococcus sp. IEGM 1366 TaxID=3082223 RepID=UPI0029541616|nr:3'-5' exonuclease [Rhodococcus sp. IEGM 1366]MDV8066414.1 3'-5' exonuclease [Rhodococcus sp. IEGM 1366]